MLKDSYTGRDFDSPDNVVPALLPTFPFPLASPDEIADDYGFLGGNPDCDRYALDVLAYHDGELNPSQRVAVEKHLEACADCREMRTALQTTDETIQREWRNGTASLPSVYQRDAAIDAIMAALPAAPETVYSYTPRRIHARARWMRFATGVAGFVALIGLLWSSYRIGYSQGKLNAVPQAPNIAPHSGTEAFPALPRLERTDAVTSFTQAFRQFSQRCLPVAPDLRLSRA